MGTSLAAQRFIRVSLSMYNSVELRETIVGLGAALATVYGIGVAESFAVLSSEFCGDNPLQAAQFANRYALEQILPSAICMPAKPASSVALFLGHEPSAVLAAPFCSAGALPYDYAHVCSNGDAGLLLRQQGLAATRCTLATLSVLTMMLRTVTLSIHTAHEFKERIKAGREPLFRGVSERVIRLCGRTSDVTSLSLSRYGAHIVPIFERPAIVQALIAEHSRDFQRPVYWHVAEGAYSQIESWSRFHISSDMFLRTTTGRQLLYLEADTTNHERSLSLSARSTDLTIDDASQGFRLIAAAARRMLDDGGSSIPGKQRPLLRTMRVVLGDPRQCESAKTTAQRRNLRSRIRKLGEADVLVDSQASVLEAVLRWCAHVGAPPRLVEEPVAQAVNAERRAAHMEAKMVAGLAEEAEAATARARRKTRVAIEAAEVAEEEEAVAKAAVAAAASSSRMAAPGRSSLSADAAVSAKAAVRKAARAAGDAEEAELLAAVAGADEAAARVTASHLPERTIVLETDSHEYAREVQAVLRGFDIAVIEEMEAEHIEEQLAVAMEAATKACNEAAALLAAARAEASNAMEAMAAEVAEMAEKEQAAGATVAAAMRQSAEAKLSRISALQEKLPEAPTPYAQLPRLVYLASTSETANAVQSLVRAGIADPSRCCAILDMHDGVHMLRALMSSEGAAKWAPSHRGVALAAAGENERPLVDVVDCSTIYDDLLRQVRVWARLGHSAEEIQAELDARFQSISDVLDRTLDNV